MSWVYRFDERALKRFKKLGHQTQQEISHYFKKHIIGNSDPRRFGKELKGDLSGVWRYRIGHYRVLCKIKDHELLVLVIGVGHRKNVYK